MSLLQNTVLLLYVNLVCLSFSSNSLAVPTGIGKFFKVKDKHYSMMIVLFKPADSYVNENDGGTLSRTKRQSGGKFSDASKMSQRKVMQLYLQLFKNMVAGSSVGGHHPMAPDTVKPTVQLFKQHIIAFFFPELGDDES